MSTFTGTRTFEITTCCSCHIEFGVTQSTLSSWRENHTSHYCPSCGVCQSFRGESKTERLRRENHLLQTRLTSQEDRAEAWKRSAAAQKGQVTKIRKRIGKGVCPCCSRTFVDLARHMNNKHPKYSEAPDG